MGKMPLYGPENPYHRNPRGIPDNPNPVRILESVPARRGRQTITTTIPKPKVTNNKVHSTLFHSIRHFAHTGVAVLTTFTTTVSMSSLDCRHMGHWLARYRYSRQSRLPNESLGKSKRSVLISWIDMSCAAVKA